MAEHEDTSAVPDLTLDFVRKIMGTEIVSFTITPGSAPGDNYMSVLYCFECVLPDGQVIYGICKCCPSHPARQDILNKGNVFWNELSIYKEFIPTLDEFQKKLGLKMKLPFPPLISGEAINFGTGKVNEERVAQYSGKTLGPFDNYIMMVDLKKKYGFQMANRMVGLNLDEVALVMAEHSKLHALSWAHKVKNGIQDLSDKMPYLDFHMNNDMDMWNNITSASCQNAYDSLKSMPGVNPGILDGILKFKKKIVDVIQYMYDSGSPRALEKFLRVKPGKDETADEESWRVVLHGDCCIVNLLFRYDDMTKKAVELILIDLQMMREACPTIDLAYMFYTSTTAEFRRNHLDDMLQLYHDNFRSYCDQLSVECLPGFTLENLKRRFHTSKLIGLTMALMALPILLKESNNVQDLEKFNKEANIVDMMDSMTGGFSENSLYKERLLGVCNELFNDGVL